MSFFESLITNLTSVLEGDNPNYGSWAHSLAAKVDNVYPVLDSLIDKSDTKPMVKGSEGMKRLCVHLAEVAPDLDVEVFAGDLRNITHQHNVRVCLVKFWTKLLHIIEKVTESRHLLLVLDVITKISMRSEFDCENLHTRPPAHMEEFKKYQTLLRSTYKHLRGRLAESKPPTMALAWSYQLELPQAYARLLTILFFRLPKATGDIIKACQPPHASYNLEDYHFVPPEQFDVDSTDSFPSWGGSGNGIGAMEMGGRPISSPPKKKAIPRKPKEYFSDDDLDDLVDNSPNLHDVKTDHPKASSPEESKKRDSHNNNNKASNNANAPSSSSSSSNSNIAVQSLDKPIPPNIAKFCLSTDRLKISCLPSHIQDFPRIFAWPEFHAAIDALKQRNSHNAKKAPVEKQGGGDLPVEKQGGGGLRVVVEKTPGPPTASSTSSTSSVASSSSSGGGSARSMPSPFTLPSQNSNQKSNTPPSTNQVGPGGSSAKVGKVENAAGSETKTATTTATAPTATESTATTETTSETTAESKIDSQTTAAAEDKAESPTKEDATVPSEAVTTPTTDPETKDTNTESAEDSSGTAPTTTETTETTTATTTATTTTTASTTASTTAPTTTTASTTAPTTTVSTTPSPTPTSPSSKKKKSWYVWLRSDSAALLLFFDEFVSHVLSTTNKPHFVPIQDSMSVRVVPSKKNIEWRAIRGYRAIVNAFLYVLQNAARFSAPLMHTCNVMLRCCPLLINYYMRFTCTRTIAYQQSAVTDVLTRLAEWFSELKKTSTPLPSGFDTDFFCAVTDVVIESDHHQMLCRVIQLIYHASDLFLGSTRRAILSDFLFKKHFYNLFLHWDEVSRNYFMQLVLFKILRFKLSQLANAEGYLVSKPQKSRNGVFLSEAEVANDRTIFGKLLCYIKVIEDQIRNPAYSNAILPKHLAVYGGRAMKEYKYFQTRSEAFTGTEWKMAPMMLIDPNYKKQIVI